MKNNEWLFFSRNDLPDANGIIQQENRSSQVPNIIGDDESQGDEGGKKMIFYWQAIPNIWQVRWKNKFSANW